MSYATFGESNPLTKGDVDPTEMCVGITLFTKEGIANNLQEDFCPKFMSKRCSQNWDDKCEAYLNDTFYNPSGFTVVNKNFLSEVAKAKYCRTVPTAACATRCEAFNYLGQSSPQVCESVGTENWYAYDEDSPQDLKGDFPQSAKLTNLSPIYMGPCPQVCDMPPPDSLGPDDYVLNKCLEHGACTNVLMDLAYNVVKNNIPVKNKAFQELIKYAALQKGIDPEKIVNFAKSYGIPTENAVEILKEVRYADNTVPEQNVDKFPFTGKVPTYQDRAGMEKLLTKIVSQNDLINQKNKEFQNTESLQARLKQREGFTVTSSGKVWYKDPLTIICIILIILIIFFLMKKNK